MTTARKQPRALRTLASTLLLALLVALLLAGTALAAAKPGKPTAKAPKGTITTTKPTFAWSKAKGAAKYELRVSQGSKLLLKKTGLKKTNWTSTTALPAGVDLTWKVRASNARGAGAWSKGLAFKVEAPGPSLKIGDAYGGGIVAYILTSIDPGYVAGQTHGLIAAVADQTPADSGIQWATTLFWSADVPGAKGLAIGTGAANTTAIVAQNGAGTTYAAGLARAYSGGGYSDWCLPSRDELYKLYIHRAAIGGFNTTGDYWYWASSQAAGDGSYAWCMRFLSDSQYSFAQKYNPGRVRAVRSF